MGRFKRESICPASASLPSSLVATSYHLWFAFQSAWFLPCFDHSLGTLSSIPLGGSQGFPFRAGFITLDTTDVLDQVILSWEGRQEAESLFTLWMQTGQPP